MSFCCFVGNWSGLGGFVVFLGMPFSLSSFLGVVIIVNLVFL